MYNELVAVTLIIVYERIFERCKVERIVSMHCKKTGTKLNNRKVIMSV